MKRWALAVAGMLAALVLPAENDRGGEPPRGIGSGDWGSPTGRAFLDAFTDEAAR